MQQMNNYKLKNISHNLKFIYSKQRNIKQLKNFEKKI